MTITQNRIKNKKDLFMRDDYVSKIFRNPKNKDYVLRVLRGAFKDEEVFQSDDLELLNVDISTTARAVGSSSDFVAENDKIYINIEINFSRYYNTYIENKNTSYMCWLALRQIPKGDKKKYDDVKPIYQLNLNLYDKLGKGEFIYESVMMDTKYHIISNKLYKIVDVNIAYLKEKDYNEIRKTERDSLERSVYFMQTDEKGLLDELYEGDDVMKKVLGQLNEYDETGDSYLIYDKAKMMELESYDIGHKDGLQIGLQKGLKKGAQQEKLEIAKEMRALGYNAEEIHKITKIPIENLEKI